MAVRFLEVIKPFCAVLPEVEKPQRRVSNSTLEKIFYNFFFGTMPIIQINNCKLQPVTYSMLHTTPHRNKLVDIILYIMGS